MTTPDIREQVVIALDAVDSRKAEDISVLQLPREASALTDYFLICSGTNPRQVQAIADEVDERLSRAGVEPLHREGYDNAEWILLDYVDFVVHIFSSQERLRNLERLWNHSDKLTREELLKPAKKASTATRDQRKPTVKKPAAKAPAKHAGAKRTAKKTVRTAHAVGRKSAAKRPIKKAAKKASKRK
jgi:ribosome-associated protein